MVSEVSGTAKKDEGQKVQKAEQITLSRSVESNRCLRQELEWRRVVHAVEHAAKKMATALSLIYNLSVIGTTQGQSHVSIQHFSPSPVFEDSQ